ncbi:MAG: flagellar basal body protein [Pirellulaceae bacterium]|jgi:flagellar basal-body rod protein FlgB|nr:flagellar basal body protein [Pirellulaceae bacterium]
MLSELFASTSIPVLGEVLNFTQARQGVLAGNIANVNTPGYRTRDLSPAAFQEQLKAAISESRSLRLSRRESLSPGLSSPGLSSPGLSSAGLARGSDEPSDPIRQVSASLENILYHDDTNIDLEKQVAEISKNQLLHNFALTVMTDQFRLLESAISERV